MYHVARINKSPSPANRYMTKLLFVCSRNQWRSPTGEQVWRRQPGIQARSAGTSPNARRKICAADISWADVIFVMEKKAQEPHRRRVRTPAGAQDHPRAGYSGRIPVHGSGTGRAADRGCRPLAGGCRRPASGLSRFKPAEPVSRHSMTLGITLLPPGAGSIRRNGR